MSQNFVKILQQSTVLIKRRFPNKSCTYTQAKILLDAQDLVPLPISSLKLLLFAPVTQR